MSETFETIQRWGKDTFGDNITLEGQVEKWMDEKREFEETSAMTPDELFELADLVIVSANIMRFDFKTGFHYLAETFKLLAVTKNSGEELWNAVEKKMTVNRSRKWSVGKGNFQHISEGCEDGK